MSVYLSVCEGVWLFTHGNVRVDKGSVGKIYMYKFIVRDGQPENTFDSEGRAIAINAALCTRTLSWIQPKDKENPDPWLAAAMSP